MNKFGSFLILIGVAMVAFSVYDYLPQFMIGQHGEESVKEALANNEEQQDTTSEELYKERPEMDQKFGELIIPKLEAVLPIIEGTDQDQLDRGVGHYRNSVLPGEPDNTVLSGHRDTVFRKLGELEIGDVLIVQTTAGTFHYEIKKTWITEEDDRTVIVPHKGKYILTLTTCYPFNWIGSAPQRYIIQAELINA